MIKVSLQSNGVIMESNPITVRGSKVWRNKSGHWHRLDGPAYIELDDDGNIIVGFWYINNNPVHTKITKWAYELGIDLDNLTDDDKTIIAMVWSEYKG